MAADRFCRRIDEVRRIIFSIHKNKGLYSLPCRMGASWYSKKWVTVLLHAAAWLFYFHYPFYCGLNE
jgi:hypothetical protein